MTPPPFKMSASQRGITVAELLIALVLMSLVMLSFSNFVITSNVKAASLNMRFVESGEIQMLLMDIQKDFKQGALISDNSYNNRLEYTTYDATGAATKKIYRITTVGGFQYLQLSLDGGSTWQSPYRMSAYTQYRLLGTPKFLYAAAINNCTDFADSTGNGVWLSGSDTAGVYLACSEGTSTPVLSTPSQANKVDFRSFQFSTGKGSPEATRALPTDFYLALNPPLVGSSPMVPAVAPAVKDSPVVKSFVTNTANSLFGTAFNVQSAAWDPQLRRLVIVGTRSSGSNTIYLADRLGVLIGSGLTTSASTIQAYSTAITSDSNSILVLGSTDGGTTYNVYGFNLAQAAPLSTQTTLSLSGLVNNPSAIAYDPATPDDFYVVGTEPVTNLQRIWQRNRFTGTLVNVWTLPGSFTVSLPPGGLAIDPVTGSFLVVRNWVIGSFPYKCISISRMLRDSSSTTILVNVNDLGSTATGTTGKWGLGYDPITNQLFLSDSASNQIYTVLPNQLLSPKS